MAGFCLLRLRKNTAKYGIKRIFIHYETMPNIGKKFLLHFYVLNSFYVFWTQVVSIPFHNVLVRNDIYFVRKEMSFVSRMFFVINEIHFFTNEIYFVTYGKMFSQTKNICHEWILFVNFEIIFVFCEIFFCQQINNYFQEWSWIFHELNWFGNIYNIH